MYNRRVKFGLKIPNSLGKMSENFRGGGLTHTVDNDSADDTSAGRSFQIRGPTTGKESPAGELTT